MLDPDRRSKVADLSSLVNLGLALPMGSVKGITQLVYMITMADPNLNAGKGNPWAGQVTEMADPDTLS